MNAHSAEGVLREKAQSAFRKQKFEELYKIIANNNFSAESHREMQDLWIQARYYEVELSHGKTLDAVGRSRVRDKFPYPRTIWDGEETKYNIKEKSRNLLKESYSKNRYLSAEVKHKLTAVTGLKASQVENWFKNRRQREKPSVTKPPRKPRKPRKTVNDAFQEHYFVGPEYPPAPPSARSSNGAACGTASELCTGPSAPYAAMSFQAQEHYFVGPHYPSAGSNGAACGTAREFYTGPSAPYDGGMNYQANPSTPPITPYYQANAHSQMAQSYSYFP